MAYRDYYNVLGVTRDADNDEIKKAYRGLAMRYHPDRNPSPEAVDHFKDVTRAYRTLSDPAKRARYDRLGPLYTDDGRPPRPEEVSDAAGTMWDNLFAWRSKPRPGEDLRFTITITLEQVHQGIDKEITVPRQVQCPDCGGAGALLSGRSTCTACEGTGKSRGPRLFRSSCYHCEGRGFTITDPCARCHAEGLIHHDERLTIKVPPGVATGQKLKVRDKGNDPRGPGKTGDLFVLVNVADHPLFRRRGTDVIAEMPLTFIEVALGAEVDVPTLDGVTRIRVPPGTPHGKVFRLAGRGLSRVGRSTHGDLHLEVVIEVPSDLSTSERDLLAKWAGLLPHERHPRRTEFEQRLEERR